MLIIKKCVLIVLTCLSICSVAQAKDTKNPDWRLYVAFLEEDVGSINRKSTSYEFVWIRRDSQEAHLAKNFKLAQKKMVEGTKNRIYVRMASTGSSNYVMLYDSVRMTPMWKGSDKPLHSIRFVSGSSIPSLNKRIEKSAAEYKYISYKKIMVINMIAAKTALNAQSQNPYTEGIPKSNQDPCPQDPSGQACRAIAMGVRG